MANTRELRRRIKSVKSTAQITKAMQMVAATKMRKAQNQALSGRPYSSILNQAIATLLPRIETSLHPLLGHSHEHENLDSRVRGNDNQKSGVILLTTDKGLCGALNTNIFRATTQFLQTQKDPMFYTVGKKGRSFVVKMNKDLAADFENTDLITFRQAVQISKLIVPAFLNNELKEVYLIYPDFVSTLRQEARVVRLLPIDLESLKTFMMDLAASNERHSGERSDSRNNSAKDSGQARMTEKGEFLFEPDLSQLLDFILTHFVETKIYQALLETKASEHSARMMAMQNATDNAKDLVDDLTLSYNQTRQESITRELLEITSALAALE